MTPSELNPGINQAQVAGHPSPQNASRFELPYRTLGTLRFGEYTPHFCLELVQGDKNVDVRCNHVLRTLPMQSPIFNRMKMHKAYFNVPLMAIIPRNYEKWKVNPVQGQDVPADCGTSVDNFMTKVKTFHDNYIANASFVSSKVDATTTLLDFFRYLTILQWFGSAGSLLSSLEISVSNHFFHSIGSLTPDRFVDMWMNGITGYYDQNVTGTSMFTWYIGTDSYNVFSPKNLAAVTPGPADISLRDFFYRFLQQPIGSISTPVGWDLSDVYTFLTNAGVDAKINETFSISVNDDVPVDLRRLHAYNLACVHFMTNDHIDYIYTAELYRQNMWALYIKYAPSTLFSWNGILYQYDALCGYVVGSTLTSTDFVNIDPRFSYLSNVFNFQRSLRFIDYFTGSRTSPLAVGITNVAVSGGQVSVIDITKGIQKQRFLNAVNRAGAKFESYLKGVFGVKPAYDFHNPAYLGATEDDVFAEEIENTATDMADNSSFIRSNMQSNAGRFAFNFDADRDSVVIGVTYFDIPRYHPFGIPRICQHLDRFDDFIPESQYIGDQDINHAELGDVSSSSTPFSYTDRYQEYKIRKSYCFGGSREYLPTWLYMLETIYQQPNISPDFIRSNCVELDKFFTQLSTYSYAGYFHFIIFNEIECSAVRPMVKHPQIL